MESLAKRRREDIIETAWRSAGYARYYGSKKPYPSLQSQLMTKEDQKKEASKSRKMLDALEASGAIDVYTGGKVVDVETNNVG